MATTYELPLSGPELRKRIARARARFDELDAQTRTLVKKRPLSAMGAAVLIGYVLGRLLRRR